MTRPIATGPPPLWLGCSGWEYPEWVGRFYPSGARVDHLGFYSQIFRVVEINSSFYRTPSVRSVESWARKTPVGFRFTAKLPQEVTHVRRLEGTDEPLRAFYAAFQPLVDAGKLLAVLLQLPPTLTFEAANVRRFYESLPTTVPVAVEFRHPSWLVPESFDLLREFRLANTVVDEPLLPVDLSVTSSLAYVRWHGHGTPLWYDYTYAPEQLAAWVPRLRQLAESASTVVAFFNNHFRADAPANALDLQSLLGLPPPPWSRRLDVPDLRLAPPRHSGAPPGGSSHSRP